jgi:hypothetical protein
MRKLTLSLDALSVESFDTTPLAREKGGTVHGHACDCSCCCGTNETCRTCDESACNTCIFVSCGTCETVCAAQTAVE